MNKYELVKEITNAILNGKRIYIVKGRTYDLPEGQRSGTYFQQYTYAMLKAKELVL